MKENNFEKQIDEIYGISPTNKTIKEYENVKNLLIKQTKENEKIANEVLNDRN